jgi:hypothetical protein
LSQKKLWRRPSQLLRPRLSRHQPGLPPSRRKGLRWHSRLQRRLSRHRLVWARPLQSQGGQGAPSRVTRPRGRQCLGLNLGLPPRRCHIGRRGRGTTTRLALDASLQGRHKMPALLRCENSGARMTKDAREIAAAHIMAWT